MNRQCDKKQTPTNIDNKSLKRIKREYSGGRKISLTSGDRRISTCKVTDLVPCGDILFAL